MKKIIGLSLLIFSVLFLILGCKNQAIMHMTAENVIQSLALSHEQKKALDLLNSEKK